MYVLGLMSGTSADGVEAVLAQFIGDPNNPKWSLVNSVSMPYPVALSEQIINVSQGLELSSQEWLELAEAITEIHADAAKTCDPQRQSELVGCHGQTVWHRPCTSNKRGASLQLLQAPLLAQLFNRPVVHDFRSVDLALGGHGAPLAPLLDAALFGRINGWRAIINLGGISNITLIPPNSGPDRCASVMGWDCGPANTLVDFAVLKMSNGALRFDRDGLIAASGSPDEEIIQRWLKEPFFQKAPPKSTGREEFGLADLERRLKEISTFSNEDMIATLTAFTSAVIAQDLDHLKSLDLVRPIELLVAGGGCRNLTMLRELQRRCLGMRVLTVNEYGIPIESREALSFALLAWWHLREHFGNSPVITGAIRAGILGIKVNPA